MHYSFTNLPAYNPFTFTRYSPGGSAAVQIVCSLSPGEGWGGGKLMGWPSVFVISMRFIFSGDCMVRDVFVGLGYNETDELGGDISFVAAGS